MEHIIKHTKKGSVYFTDTFRSYRSLKRFGKHHTISHGKKFPKTKNHINGIEGFWSFAKHVLYNYRGVSKYHFPMYLTVDVLKGLGNSNLILSLDALHPSDDVESLNIGAEYVFSDMISLRGGYKSLFAKDSEQGWNFGGGIRYGIGSTNLRVDYSYISFGLLSNINMFSIGLGL